MQNSNATQQLIDLAAGLSPTGVIGDGMVATFHDLAARARVEQATPILGLPGFVPPRPDRLTLAERALDRARAAHDSATYPGRRRTEEAQAEVTAARQAACDHPGEAVHRAPDTAGLGVRCGKCGLVAVPRA